MRYISAVNPELLRVLRRFIFFLNSFILVTFLFPMDWPSASGIITKNFGWNNSGQPQLGVSFEDDGVLRAAEEGELLYLRREGDTASRLPSPLGCWAALDHGDGIISMYSRFSGKPSDDTSLEGTASADTSAGSIPAHVEKNRVLGESGISGWSVKKGFYFQLFDRKEKRWINPAMIIKPPEDTRPPTILSVRLKNAEGKLFDLFQTKVIGQGRYTVAVDATDTMRLPNESPLAPYRIICSVNGSETGVLNFETYSARDGTLVVYRNGLIPVKQVYLPGGGYEVADVWFTRGQTSLEIIASDIAGNVRNMVFRFMVE